MQCPDKCYLYYNYHHHNDSSLFERAFILYEDIKRHSLKTKDSQMYFDNAE